jgi:dynein heavy chain
MDYRICSKIFKGLAMSGAWGCFDEFNRIELDVLSVVAQQIACVLAAMKERRDYFTYVDGQLVSLDFGSGYFITMNPGYAGRTELPENLKALFRSVSMMVPDRQIIMRVKLASQGYQEAIMLSKKFFLLYRLCEEQLSKQRHYDFGLRNILSVLRTAGFAKRASPGLTEPVILFRVLRDMNLSKLVDEDEPLFLSLLNDLFPGLGVDKNVFEKLESAIQNNVSRSGLVNHSDWNLKVLQLYETQLVRHSIMVLGPSGAGKTCAIRTLLGAFEEMGTPHKEVRMNPKAFTATQMFGRLDVATNDWTDGIFAVIYRKACKEKNKYIWITNDGPVDTLWIENLNSVMDDSKTLTLANGDRIIMSPTLKLIFEVANLDNASPATVSRAGIIFMSSSSLGWRPLVQAWVARQQPEQGQVFRELFDLATDRTLFVMSEEMDQKMQLEDCNKVATALTILDTLLEEHKKANLGDKLPDQWERVSLSREHLSRLFTFAFLWGVCCLLEPHDRANLMGELRKHGDLDLPVIPKGRKDVLWDYYVDPATAEWRPWADKVPHWDYPRDRTPEFSSILVPTVDIVRMNYLMGALAAQGKATLLIGQAGSAKTVTTLRYLESRSDDSNVFKTLNFSSATTAGIFQRAIEGSVEKRQGRIFGPPSGKKMILFIDDLNMPDINEWNDQPTNEIVRQLVEEKGFYDLEKPGEWSFMHDIAFVAAMGHPGGGRNDIPARLKRHFGVFNCTLPSDSSLAKIYGTILRGHFCPERGFATDVVGLAPELVELTRTLWEATKKKMLPTPTKIHYIFNMRDLTRIVQGLLAAEAEVITARDDLLILWKHECDRVFPDRFTNFADKVWFSKELKSLISAHFGEPTADKVLVDRYFVNFLRDAPEFVEGDQLPEAPKVYETAQSIASLRHRAETFMASFNDSVRGQRLDLVLFDDALIHLVKISRIISMPRGSALLVGVGGSGKQSLTRLAAFIQGYKTFQLSISRTYNVTNLFEDIKNLYRMTGLEGKSVAFIFTDAEIKQEGFLEYINNILSSGEVANLFAKDEIDAILNDLRPVAKKLFGLSYNDTMDNLYKFFIERVRNNLHVVLCFSPVGEKFRSRTRKFPALISGCTIDWFLPWSKAALLAVADKFISTVDIAGRTEVKRDLVEYMAFVHDSMGTTTEEYFTRFRRHVYVTPKSYLSFIKSYITVYTSKRARIQGLKQELSTGLEKLIQAGKDIEVMKVELDAKKKDVSEASAKAEVNEADKFNFNFFLIHSLDLPPITIPISSPLIPVPHATGFAW